MISYIYASSTYTISLKERNLWSLKFMEDVSDICTNQRCRQKDNCGRETSSNEQLFNLALIEMYIKAITTSLQRVNKSSFSLPGVDDFYKIDFTVLLILLL